MTGTTNDTTITVRPVINPVKFHSHIYWLPTAGIQLATKNGSATTNLIPNDYNVTIAGVPGSWKISVSDTNVTLNAAEIGNLTVYSANGPLPGVLKINAGNNITISPPSGMGVVTINSTGGGAATNGFQSQAGNRLITISTNLTDLIYTFSGVSQTNGYPWGSALRCGGRGAGGDEWDLNRQRIGGISQHKFLRRRWHGHGCDQWFISRKRPGGIPQHEQFRPCRQRCRGNEWLSMERSLRRSRFSRRCHQWIVSRERSDRIPQHEHICADERCNGFHARTRQSR